MEEKQIAGGRAGGRVIMIGAVRSEMTEISAISALSDTDTERQISFHAGLPLHGRQHLERE